MTRSLYLGLILIMAFTISCRNNNIKNKAIKMDLNYEKMDSVSYMSSFFENNQIIILEDTNNAFISQISKLTLLDSIIIITDTYTKSIFFYNLKGNLINKINKVGKGPGEYLSIQNSWINTLKKQVEIYDRERDMVYIYDMQGNFIKKFTSPGFITNFASQGDFRYFYRDKLGFLDENGKETKIHLITTQENKRVKSFFKLDYFVSSSLSSNQFARINNNSLFFWINQEYIIYNITRTRIEPIYQLVFQPKPIMNKKYYKNAFTYKSINEIKSKQINGIGNFDNLLASNDYMFFTFGKQVELGKYNLISCIYNRKKESFQSTYSILVNDIDELHVNIPKYINDTIFIFTRPRYTINDNLITNIEKKYGVKIKRSSNPILIISKIKKNETIHLNSTNIHDRLLPERIKQK